jgi:hypothetical protein
MNKSTARCLVTKNTGPLYDYVAVESSSRDCEHRRREEETQFHCSHLGQQPEPFAMADSRLLHP